MRIQVEIYETAEGAIPFLEWLENLNDEVTKDIILGRIQRLRLGLFGKWKIIKGAKNIFELKVDYGPGYRVYYANKEKVVVLLLLGGKKGNQKRDIKKAKEYWKDFLRRSEDGV